MTHNQGAFQGGKKMWGKKKKIYLGLKKQKRKGGEIPVEGIKNKRT